MQFENFLNALLLYIIFIKAKNKKKAKIVLFQISSGQYGNPFFYSAAL